jgi:hypothetical protein
MYAPHVIKAYIQDGQQYNTPPPSPNKKKSEKISIVAVGLPYRPIQPKRLQYAGCLAGIRIFVALVSGYRLAEKPALRKSPHGRVPG